MLWRHDLAAAFGAAMPYFGHAASPLVVDDWLVVAAGGVFAFDLGTGALRWSNPEIEASYSSPILVEGPRGRRLVVAGASEIVGLDPLTGRTLWSHPHANAHRTTLSTPLADETGLIFASAYFLGSVALQERDDGSVAELWRTRSACHSHRSRARPVEPSTPGPPSILVLVVA